MEPPTVVTTVRDQANNVTYRILAYRTVTKQEAWMAIARHGLRRPGRKIKPNEMFTITTNFGVQD